MTERQPERATPENWWSPPQGRWTFDQVKDLELPFDWELMDGEIVVRGQTPQWHDMVRDRLFFQLESARRDPLVGNVERCVMVNDRTVIKPDVVLFDKRDLDFFTLECVPAAKVRLAVEVVSPGSEGKDRSWKPSMMAASKVPYFWRIERSEDHLPFVHEFWLNHDTESYIPAPEHPVHKEKLITEFPFPVEIDLRSLVEF
ncbi:Uma2 family endonuclease [Streptomyces sp. 6N223]|uniref:Uma2 family endonuclease n=1 Tax=Streptomyces sp. 6N223 TaxID=3457412 RepID=UPI003FD07CDA